MRATGPGPGTAHSDRACARAQGVDASTGATFDPVVVHRPAFDPFHKSNITQVVGELIPGVGGIIPNVSNILNPLGASLSG